MSTSTSASWARGGFPNLCPGHEAGCPPCRTGRVFQRMRNPVRLAARVTVQASGYPAQLVSQRGPGTVPVIGGEGNNAKGPVLIGHQCAHDGLASNLRLCR